jgi:hypothetical protein
MSKFCWIAVAALALAGCQSENPSAAAPSPADATQTAAKPDLAEPGTVDPSRIALWKNRDSVRVGSDPDKAFDAFRGDRPGGFQSDVPPPGLGPAFKAKVWQGAQIGFGVISYKGNVSAAVYEDDAMTQDDLNNVVASYTEHMGSQPQMITGDRVNYWFWTEPFTEAGRPPAQQRLMIMAFAGGTDGTVFCAIIMGDGLVLDTFGANPATAAGDQVAVDKIMGRRDIQPTG